MHISYVLFSFLLFESISGDVVVEQGELHKTISCPDATKWFNPFGDLINPANNVYKYKIDGYNLTIHRIGEMDVGKYFCTVNNSNQTVVLEAQPRIKHLDKSVNVVQGTPVSVECVAWGYPKPMLTWSRVGDNSSTVNLGHSAVFTINETTMEDYGTYRCTVTNKHATANQTTKIRVKDKMAPLWPFIGILLEVLVLVIIIIVYERRKHKNEPEDVVKDPSKSESKKDSSVRMRK